MSTINPQLSPWSQSPSQPPTPPIKSIPQPPNPLATIPRRLNRKENKDKGFWNGCAYFNVDSKKQIERLTLLKAKELGFDTNGKARFKRKMERSVSNNQSSVDIKMKGNVTIDCDDNHESTQYSIQQSRHQTLSPNKSKQCLNSPIESILNHNFSNRRLSMINRLRDQRDDSNLQPSAVTLPLILAGRKCSQSSGIASSIGCKNKLSPDIDRLAQLAHLYQPYHPISQSNSSSPQYDRQYCPIYRSPNVANIRSHRSKGKIISLGDIINGINGINGINSHHINYQSPSAQSSDRSYTIENEINHPNNQLLSHLQTVNNISVIPQNQTIPIHLTPIAPPIYNQHHLALNRPRQDIIRQIRLGLAKIIQ